MGLSPVCLWGAPSCLWGGLHCVSMGCSTVCLWGAPLCIYGALPCVSMGLSPVYLYMRTPGGIFGGTHPCPPPPVKLPQVLRVLGARSGAGLSVPGVLLELLALAGSVAYGCSRAFPFSAWGEALFLLLQTMTLGFLMQHFGGHTGRGKWGLWGGHPWGCCWWLVTGCYWVPSSPPTPPPGLITFLQAANLPIIILSRVRGGLLQAATNYRQGHTGQLSGVTTTLLFGGALARVFTSLQETGDPLLALTFATSAACNGLLLGQLLYYRGGTPKSPPHPKVD
uniref:Mannose-P-dolichol utilization defect 1 protein n=1 Tax=Strigops habroptila TaxID=2489341 RepID=A0A672UQ23_STRHB